MFSACVDEPLDRRVADPAARTVRDPQERRRVLRVDEHAEVRRRVADLGALVEARAADDLVRDVLPHEHVLQHPRLRVRPVEDRDLAGRVAALDERGDLGRDEPCLGVLVLDLDRRARGRPRRARRRDASACARVFCSMRELAAREDVVRRAVVLLERDHPRAGEVALELHDVADVGAAERVDRVVGDDAVRDEVVRPLDVEVVDRAVELDALDASRRRRTLRAR